MNKLSGFVSRLLMYIPSPLPRGMSEFNEWYAKILTTFNLPDGRSYKNAIATMVMHLGPTCDRKSRAYFAKSVRKAISNEIAYAVIQEVRAQAKLDEEAAAAAAQLQPSAEATHTSVVSDPALEQNPSA